MSESNANTLLCYFEPETDLSPEMRRRIVDLVERLRGTQVPTAELIDEIDAEEPTDPEDEPLMTFGIWLEMAPSDPERQSFDATYAVLDGVRRLTVDNDDAFTVEWDGESIGSICRGTFSKGIEEGLLKPWRARLEGVS
jgi:uncharacterized protein with von Willebrand factor type A (vWA) domain